MSDERIADAAALPPIGAEWYVIHAGQELGPFSLGDLAEKAIIGRIEPDDLVRQTGGLWTKAREVRSLQEQFRLKQVKQDSAASDTRITDLQQSPGNTTWQQQQPNIAKSAMSPRAFALCLFAVLLFLLAGATWWLAVRQDKKEADFNKAQKEAQDKKEADINKAQKEAQQRAWQRGREVGEDPRFQREWEEKQREANWIFNAQMDDLARDAELRQSRRAMQAQDQLRRDMQAQDQLRRDVRDVQDDLEKMKRKAQRDELDRQIRQSQQQFENATRQAIENEMKRYQGLPPLP